MKAIFKDKRNIFLLVILSITIFSYSNTFHVPFMYDDTRAIENNLFVNGAKSISLKHLVKSLLHGGRPLTLLTFRLNYKLNELNVEGYHLVNLVIHLLNIILLYVFLKKAAHKTSTEKSFIAEFVTAMFAVHPLQTEAVTYIVQRSEILSSLFYIVTLLMLISYTENTGKRAAVFLFLASVSMLLGWSSKAIIVTAPLIYILYYLLFGTKNEKRKCLKTAVPILFIALAAGLVLSFNLNPQSNAGFQLKEISPADYLLTQFRVFITYMRLIFIPISQNLDYDYPVYRTFWNPDVLLSFVIVMVMVGYGVYAVMASTKLTAEKRLSAFGLLWFFVILAPTSTIIPLRDIAVEHRVYLAMVGVLLTAFALMYLLMKKVQLKTVYMGLLVLIVMFIFSALTYSRNQLWNDPIELWADAMKKSPNKSRPHMNLAYAYDLRGYDGKAVEEYLKALELSDDSVVKKEDIYVNLGALYGEHGNYKNAIQMLEKAKKYNPSNPMIYNNLALCYFYLKDYRTALTLIKKAIGIAPEYYALHNTLGQILLNTGNYEMALKEFLTSKKLHPDEPTIYYNIAIAYMYLGYKDKALENLRIFSLKEKDSLLKSRMINLFKESFNLHSGG